jgi:Glycosyl transferase family 2
VVTVKTLDHNSKNLIRQATGFSKIEARQIMKLSIAMGTYNGAVHLPEQLASIAAQKRPPDELIVCDDCSTDQTPALIRAFATTAPMPVRLFVNEQNLGSTRNFEQAIGLCSGEVIALSDQDDVWRNDKLQLIEAALLNAPAAGLVFSDAEIVDANLNPLDSRMWTRLGFDRKKRGLVRRGRSLDVLLPGWTVTGATMAFRSKYRRLLLPIPEEIPMIHDGWIAVAIATVAEVIFLDEPLIKYRQHRGQQIGAPSHPEPEEQRSGLKRIEAALRHPRWCVDLRIILTVLRERLRAREEMFPSSNALSYIDDHLRHLDARAGLPAERLSRVPTIIRELSRLGYHRYSNGFSSAAKDLVV